MPVQYEACTVCAVKPGKEAGVFLQRLVFHEMGTDLQAAVPVVRPYTEGFVNDLLGKLRLRKKGKLSLFCGRTVPKVKIKEGELLTVMWCHRLYAGVDAVFLFVNELCGKRCDDLP